MGIKDIKLELKEIRNLNKRCIANELTVKYKKLFLELNPLECKVMTECYINGKSYRDCGIKVYYSERQIKRIVHNCIGKINTIMIKD